MISGVRAGPCRARHAAPFISLWLVLASTSGWLTSCARKAPVEPVGVSEAVERGPLRLTVEARPKEVWVGDPITVELRVSTPDDYLVRFPAVKELEELVITSTALSDPQPTAGGGLAWRQRFTIEPLRSGELQIPPLVVKYARKPTDGDGEPAFENELVTGTLKIAVRSALTTQDSVERPRDITGTLLPPAPPMSRWQLALIGGAVVGGLAGAYGVYRALRRRRLRPPPPILPEVWALAALAELAQVDWFERGRVREYYYRLTEVVRTYIERRFGLAAPEMTTEEFLGALIRDRSALPYEPERLRLFLETCDIVKYAAHRPRPEDAEEALRTARAFIDATAAARPAPAGSGQRMGGHAA